MLKIVLTHNSEYLKEAKVLVRVYENQNPEAPEKEQVVGEVLFRNPSTEEPVCFTAWLPRGLAHGVVEALRKYAQKEWVVQVSNELPYQVGVLTSCIENFDNVLKRVLHEGGLPTPVEAV